MEKRWKARPAFRLNSSARGNIVLTSALVVLALGVSGIGLLRMLRAYLDLASDVRLTNYAETGALSAAESGLNFVLDNWYNGGAVGSIPATPGVNITYTTAYTMPGGGTLNVPTALSYNVTLDAGGPPYILHSAGWAHMTDANVKLSNSALYDVRRTITISVVTAGGFPYAISGYSVAP